ncbi:hypothetical protein PAXINDRAFT_83157 [Paxillus involutus ATCC 200175]|uniref:Major facilitator superfamily (MFS) profile domain-containing protein n=1 Tax=Paxillus involutus ATCC 200175 TaxID=664439 RepID=A0A0C9T9G7_PAXIN|nr:hypothetical protein PAXINDRAFT_83157 [Paxillus involutus ATCC 200175]
MTSSLKLTDQTNLLPFKKLVIVYSGLALCVAVSALDSVIIATALPTISASFNAGSVVSWVPSAYMLTSTSFQPLYGRLSDIFGRKAALCSAMVVFMIGSLLSGFSRSITELIVCRGFAGAGGGGILSMAQIIISDIVSLRDRGKYQGIIGGVVALGYAIGPPVGGALSERVSWRWCFWVNLPLSLFAVCAVLFVLPLKPVEGAEIGPHICCLMSPLRRKLLSIDYIGSGLTLVGSVLIILPLIWGGVKFPWNSSIVLAPLCSGVLVIFLFCCWEWKGASLPIVPSMSPFGFLYYSSIYYLPQLFQVALGYSPIRSGVFLLPVLISESFASWIAGMIVSRTGRYRTIVYAGFSLGTIGCGCLSTVTQSTPRALLVFYMLLVGFGAGQTQQTTTVAVQASVSRKDMSVVTAVKNFVRLFGGTLSLAVGSTLINNSLRTALSSLALTSSAITTIIDDPTVLGPNTSTSQLAALGLSPSQAGYALTHGYTAGFKFVFILNACLAGVATVSSIFMIKHKELMRGDEQRLRAEARQVLENGGNGEKGVSQQLSLDSRDSETDDSAPAVDVEMGSVVVSLTFHVDHGLSGC